MLFVAHVSRQCQFICRRNESAIFMHVVLNLAKPDFRAGRYTLSVNKVVFFDQQETFECW